MSLPVAEVIPDLLKKLSSSKQARAILKAPTGSGKSTEVPRALVDSGLLDGRIVVVQPRRLAARLLAGYLSRLLDSKLGDKVGFSVRFEAKYHQNTKLVYVTDGVLQRWLAEKDGLAGVSLVIFDEFHERRLASDLSLARIKTMQEEGRAIRLLVMSATLDVGELESYLEPCLTLQAQGRSFPVEISYAGRGKEKRNRFGYLEREQVWDRVGKVFTEWAQSKKFEQGHVLIFMPGVYEIRRTLQVLEKLSAARGYQLCPLYSGLSPDAQRAAVEGTHEQPRLIVATNVAETSITIDGIRLVIDSGLARSAHYDSRRELDVLRVQPISQAAAEQRAGRAGRTGPGQCIRLNAEGEQVRLPAFEVAEVGRVDLTQARLYLAHAGLVAGESFTWFEEPPVEAWERAGSLLERIDAMESEQLTPLGRSLAVFPLHPRQARLLLAGEELSCLAEACFAAAVLDGERLWLKQSERERDHLLEDDDWSDFEVAWRAVSAAKEGNFRSDVCDRLGLSGRASREVWASYEQLLRIAKSRGMLVDKPRWDYSGRDVARCLLLANADRVGVRLGQGTLACRLVGQRKGQLEKVSVLGSGGEKAFVATSLAEVEGKALVTYVQYCARIELDWLKELFPSRWRESAGDFWNEDTRRVVAMRQVTFDELVIEEEEGGEVNRERAGEIVAEQLLAGGVKLKHWTAGVETWIARLNFLAETMPEMEMPHFGEEERRFVLASICEGAVSLKEVRGREVMSVVKDFLSQMQLATLASYAPEKISLSNGINSRVRYEDGQTPWIEEKVQRLFGVKDNPSLLGGQKLVVKLCAPNQRPWQVTQDLAGFWERGFPQMKKDLAGRYPKHKWNLPKDS